MDPRRLFRTLFPYTTLFRSGLEVLLLPGAGRAVAVRVAERVLEVEHLRNPAVLVLAAVEQDRIGTHLNSSHARIIYGGVRSIHILVASQRDVQKQRGSPVGV